MSLFLLASSIKTRPMPCVERVLTGGGAPRGPLSTAGVCALLTPGPAPDRPGSQACVGFSWFTPNQTLRGLSPPCHLFTFEIFDKPKCKEGWGEEESKGEIWGAGVSGLCLWRLHCPRGSPRGWWTSHLCEVRSPSSPSLTREGSRHRFSDQAETPCLLSSGPVPLGLRDLESP